MDRCFFIDANSNYSGTGSEVSNSVLYYIISRYKDGISLIQNKDAMFKTDSRKVYGFLVSSTHFDIVKGTYKGIPVEFVEDSLSEYIYQNKLFLYLGDNPVIEIHIVNLI